MGAIANGGSRIIMGALFDKYGFRKLYYIIIAMTIVLCATMTTVVETSKTLYAIWVFLAFYCIGSHFVLFPSVIL